MPNSNYRRGARLERLWCRQMERQGYHTTRSAGSKGAIDCIAWNKREIILAQIKNGRAAYTGADIEALKRVQRPPHTRVVLFERVGSGGVEWLAIEC